MPASSPSFPSSSDGRGKWRKRRREPQINRRLKQEDEEDDEDEAVPDENLDQQQDREDDSEDGVQPNPQSGSSAPDPSSSSSHESEVSPDGAVRCSDFPPVMRRILNRPHPSVMAIVALERANEFGESKVQGQGSSLMFLENVSHGQLQALSAVPPDCPGLDQDRSDGGNSAYVVTPPPIMEGRGVVKRFGSRSHVVPMHSDWFSPATVHRLERQVVPHFFSGKAPDHTPEKYMECRNYVVAKYMENPEKRFTVSDFVGVIAGLETEDLSRIVRFLDHWGIINYCAAASSHEPWNSNSYLTEESNGEIHVPSAALKSIDSLIKFDKPKCKLKAADVYSSLSSHDNNVSDLDNRIRERLSENHCNSCSRPLPTVYYQSHKEVDIMLCSDCFHDGRYVIGHSSLDFTRMDSTKDYGDLDGESWTDQETLLLLEAVEMYNENWNEIAEHVGTKSKAQCILHFLRLPVEDGLLENIEVPGNPISSNMSNGAVHGQISANANGDSAGSCQQDADFESRFPFANSGNPVMSLVAFLASSVGPRVAAACAHASLAALSEDSSLSASENQLQKEGPGQSNRMNSEIMHGRDSGPQGEIANSVHHKAVASRGQNEAGATPLSAEKVKAAAKAGLAAAATKAKLFADHEEREIQRLSANIINHQLKRLELKLKQFAEVETFLMKECEQVERTRQRLLAERSRFMATQMGASGITSSMSLPAAPSPSMVNNTGNNRQQIMSAPPSQPSISGYNNNNQPQQVHPHMPFRPRQQMFGMGPRLPLAAIQSPSSAPPNVMYNASGNPQPSMNHPMLRPVSGTSSGLG
ncbi:SWI/SNF complex subunit SWI3C isoform X2 [Humulus lupulus]|uniref:SWI/SNF complex subunit SWI3C isoform X2 n=1 Tax=Humulus lupulus TaxID=3486 RepID=UPI002B40A68B|nr:SWI/SNF complex subunit SWI3C isoform X2 [Humulus lupulus]